MRDVLGAQHVACLAWQDCPQGEDKGYQPSGDMDSPAAMDVISCVAEFRPSMVLEKSRKQLRDVHDADSSCKLCGRREGRVGVALAFNCGVMVDSDRCVLHGHADKLRSLVVADDTERAAGCVGWMTQPSPSTTCQIAQNRLG
eukprot:3214404-Amphidinium_carterae.6